MLIILALLAQCLNLFSVQNKEINHSTYQNKEVIDLSDYLSQICSQNGEDGVIEHIFDIIGNSSKFYVEFGATDGNWLSNTKHLREAKGWSGLLMDCDYENPLINLHKHTITAENINDLFEQYEVPADLDLLSIDIDGNDFYIWKALDKKYRPRLVVIEHNANYPPTQDMIIPYNPNHVWDGTTYFGANITALYNLARQKGYSLIYAEPSGCNLFFIPDELANHPFLNMNNIFGLYEPLVGKTFHHYDPLQRPVISSQEALD